MSIRNRDVLVVDPVANSIPNRGVARLWRPDCNQDWDTLEWELQSFVCEGEFEFGLDHILEHVLVHQKQNMMPAVWVSGAFGTGKSHLLSVIRWLWNDRRLPSGSSPRALVSTTSLIDRRLDELSAVSEGMGGAWSAAGSLGDLTSLSCRLAFLAVIFDSAGLPRQYIPARLAIWLKRKGFYERVRSAVEGAGKDFNRELSTLYFSPVLARALIDANAGFGETVHAVRAALQAQFPETDEVSLDEMLDVLEQVLQMQSNVSDKLPLTVVVLDEVQQFIDGDSVKALHLQQIVEGCSSRFGSQVLIVACGQRPLAEIPGLERLRDRFAIGVKLSGSDAEAVARNVLLQKTPGMISALGALLDSAMEGAFGSRISSMLTSEGSALSACYPLLPSRLNIWAQSTPPNFGAVRRLLLLVQDAVRSSSELRLGHIVGADYAYWHESSHWLQAGIMTDESDALICALDDGTADGKLRARVCALLVLMSCLNRRESRAPHIAVDSSSIGDMLTEEIGVDNTPLQVDVMRVVDRLIGEGIVVDGETGLYLKSEGAPGGGTSTGEVLPAPDSRDLSSETPARDYAAGDTIGGRFEVEGVLGSGGFSKVYRVRDVVEDEERALKLFDNAAGYNAVRREISALRKVDHANVVKVFWADRTDAGEWYLIMEYIDGELLAEYATGKKQLRDREAIDVALDVLSALTAIHPDGERLDELFRKKREGEVSGDEYDEWMSLSENALVHRDIKPQNIMLTQSGAKLLDFNIASRVGDPVRTVSGTPPYQPPGADLTRWDVSTDLFAVGVTLYELLCDGQHPYPQARPTLDVEPRDPRQFRKDLNETLADFLMRACASDRSTRFQTATEMKAALESARASL